MNFVSLCGWWNQITFFFFPFIILWACGWKQLSSYSLPIWQKPHPTTTSRTRSIFATILARINPSHIMIPKDMLQTQKIWDRFFPSTLWFAAYPLWAWPHFWWSLDASRVLTAYDLPSHPEWSQTLARSPTRLWLRVDPSCNKPT